MQQTIFDLKIGEYLCHTPSVCWEERQYAAILYYAFLHKKNDTERSPDVDKIIVKCLQKECGPIKIQEVFFEVALMRDFYRYNKNRGLARAFNTELLTFCTEALGKEGFTRDLFLPDTSKIINDMDETHGKGLAAQNLSNKNISGVLRCENGKTYREEYPAIELAATMMASKPDMAVYYTDGDERFLQMLECKYKSPIGKGCTIIPGIELSQIEIQNYICAFICERLVKNESVSPKETAMIRFVEKNGSFESDGDKRILIGELLTLYKN